MQVRTIDELMTEARRRMPHLNEADYKQIKDLLCAARTELTLAKAERRATLNQVQYSQQS
ncbi:hypothetical protein [Adhaeribacter aquaticus]|uniref:hypothetical protein n=1 Tax=Adhaeribacter aquaticus TaxID=299567 RepID=UPI0004791780|nr:hypothetical protein [Adhaeribacter aquaticus]